MKRVIYEWSSLVNALIALACVACWILPHFALHKSFTLIVPGNTVVASDRGNVTVGDSTFDPFQIHALAYDPTFNPTPQSIRSIGPSFVKFTQLQYPDRAAWALTVSWLVPSFIFTLLSYACFRRFRQAQMAKTQLGPAVSSGTEESVTDFDVGFRTFSYAKPLNRQDRETDV